MIIYLKGKGYNPDLCIDCLKPNDSYVITIDQAPNGPYGAFIIPSYQSFYGFCVDLKCIKYRELCSEDLQERKKRIIEISRKTGWAIR